MNSLILAAGTGSVGLRIAPFDSRTLIVTVTCSVGICDMISSLVYKPGRFATCGFRHRARNPGVVRWMIPELIDVTTASVSSPLISLSVASSIGRFPNEIR